MIFVQARHESCNNDSFSCKNEMTGEIQWVSCLYCKRII